MLISIIREAMSAGKMLKNPTKIRMTKARLTSPQAKAT